MEGEGNWGHKCPANGYEPPKEPAQDDENRKNGIYPNAYDAIAEPAQEGSLLTVECSECKHQNIIKLLRESETRIGYVHLPAQEKPEQKEKCSVEIPHYDEDGTEKDRDYWGMCLKERPCPIHDVEPEQPEWEKEFDELTDLDNALRKDSLFGEDRYPESEYELDAERIKDFIRYLLQEKNAEVVKDIEKYYGTTNSKDKLIKKYKS